VNNENTTMKLKRTLTASALLTTLILGACATTQPPPPALVDARSTVRSAQLDATVQTQAPLELKKATDSLNRANALLDKGEPMAEVSSAAYIASQQAKTAMSIAKAKSNDIAMSAAELERERARSDMRAAEAQRARAQTGAARQQTAMAEQRATGAEQRATGAEQRAVGAEQQAAVAQASATDAQQQAAELQQRLTELQAKQTERGMLVTLGDVLFESGRADVKPGAQNSLGKLATFLKQYPSRHILIEGHTDNVGSASYNEALSQRRASAVERSLTGMGVPANRVTTAGYGEEFPIAANSSNTNRALNRRVEVYIADNDQPVKSRR
jgi:outer membrane protein OmpA-like peptidoglycan-associated protein